VPPPDAVVDMLSRNKPGVVALLRPRRDGLSAEDWQITFEERAAIAEFDGGLSRARSEALAFASCVVDWLNSNFVRSAPGRCLACGGGDRKHDPLLPFVTECTGHAWLHSRCWPGWHAKRQAEAVAALVAMGLPAPAAGLPPMTPDTQTTAVPATAGAAAPAQVLVRRQNQNS
jgi:hypothetical protein